MKCKKTTGIVTTNRPGGKYILFPPPLYHIQEEKLCIQIAI
nr:MAG TPA: hypothetical protein [Caudoviricetes sp.]